MTAQQPEAGLEPAPETPEPTRGLQDALLAFTGAIGEAVPDVCTYGLIYGEAYIPFRPNEDEEDAEDSPCEDNECDQLWVRVAMVTLAGQVDSFGGSCEGLYEIALEVGIKRCAKIEDGGEAPRADDLMVGALQMMEDMDAIYRAAMSLEVWESIDAGAWLPEGPQGGQHGGVWDFTVVF